MKEIEISDPLYGTKISYLIGGTEDEMRAFIVARHGIGAKIRNKGNEEALSDNANDVAAAGQQFHVREGGERFYVWAEAAVPGVLFHETMHLAFDALHCVGLTYSDESEEAFTYWGEEIFDRVCKELFIIKNR